jgi:protein SCO1/2
VISRRELAAVGALAAILGITAAWWALALWPLPDSSPDWLQRTRLVCFGSTRDTLPTPAGWSLLIGEPLAMIAALAIIAGPALRDGLRALARTLPGRAVLSTGTLAVLAGLVAAGVRVASASMAERFDITAAEADAPRLDRPAPPLALTDQHGDRVSLARFRGRPVLVAFAYAHCTTVCPVVVHEMTDAQRRLGSDGPALLILTLDPWRDTPARLPSLARSWDVGADAHVLSGSVDEVNRILDAWEVPRTRDTTTGEVTHPAFVYIVGPDGRLVRQVPGYADAVVTALRGL